MLSDEYVKFRRRVIAHFTAEAMILSDFRNKQFTDEEIADLVATMATHPHTVKYGAVLLDAENMKRIKMILEASCSPRPIVREEEEEYEGSFIKDSEIHRVK